MGLVYVVGFILAVSVLRYLVHEARKPRRNDKSVSARWRAEHRF
jgi:hypothetical protein